MLVPLIVLFIAVPLIELALIVKAGSTFGLVPTLISLVLISTTGAWLVKREGFATLRRANDRFRSGDLPGKEMVDGVLILFAGALLMTPGFFTDLFGVLLLLPPIRAVVRRSVTVYAAKRLARGGYRF